MGFLISHLRDEDCRALTHNCFAIDAAIKLAKQRGIMIAHLQWEDFDGKELDSPVLWRYKAYVQHSEYVAMQKKKSKEDNEKWEMNKRNLKKIMLALEEFAPFLYYDDDFREQTALRLLHLNQDLSAIGCPELETMV